MHDLPVLDAPHKSTHGTVMPPEKCTLCSTSSCKPFLSGFAKSLRLLPTVPILSHEQQTNVRTGVQIGKVFKLDDIVEAHRTMEENRSGGKIVVLT